MDETTPLVVPPSAPVQPVAPNFEGNVGLAAKSSAPVAEVHASWPAQQPAFQVANQPQPPTAPPPYPSINQSVHHSVNVNVGGPTIVMINRKTGPNLFVRAVWFIFFGSWLGVLTLAAAHLATVTIIGIPLGFWLYNRVPSVATLRPRTQETQVRTTDGVTYLETMNQSQLPLWQRLLYFILVGWWLSTIWYALALVIAIGVITLPISVMMLDRIGGIATLHKH